MNHFGILYNAQNLKAKLHCNLKSRLVVYRIIWKEKAFFDIITAKIKNFLDKISAAKRNLFEKYCLPCVCVTGEAEFIHYFFQRI